LSPVEPSSAERFLVTGAYGCIGAWVVRTLVSEGSAVVTFDLSDDPRRLRLLLGPEQVEAIPHVRADISDLESLGRALDEHAITNVIHLAAMQVPFCRADPSLGAEVNVVGTINLLEAAKRGRERMRHVVYASSVAAYDALEETAAEPAMTGTPGTLYGVFKRANEGSARLYWQENGVSSIGLRPHTVYGAGRDQGLTSAPTTAMLAAAAGVPYRIPYGGASQLQYGRDVAQAFVAASRADYEGASVHNLSGRRVTMAEVVEAIATAAPESAGSITFDNVLLPFPEEVDGGSFAAVVGSLPETSLADGVRETISRFRELLAAGLLVPPSPERVTSA
jgi:UDP-glucuronate 4-epimerase